MDELLSPGSLAKANGMRIPLFVTLGILPLGCGVNSSPDLRDDDVTSRSGRKYPSENARSPNITSGGAATSANEARNIVELAGIRELFSLKQSAENVQRSGQQDAEVQELARAFQKQDQDSETRAIYPLVLGVIGRQAAGAAPALKQALEDEDVQVRWTAGRALGEIGPAAEVAVPELRELLGDETVNWVVYESLKKSLLMMTWRP